MTVRERLTSRVQAALASLYERGFLQGEPPQVLLMPPKQAAHGDYSCTVALALAKPARKKPQEIAAQLKEALGDADGMLTQTEIAGPGYLNLHVAPAVWRSILSQAIKEGADFLRAKRGAGQRVLVEFVSANPTGPLHVAHGRGAVIGDVVATLLDFAGYRVEREYYVNDLGNQADVMARSVHLRYQEAFGRPLTPPEDFYPGDYIIDMARALKADVGERYLDAPESAWLDDIRSRGIAAMLQRIRSDLDAFGVRFDHWVSERELTARVGLDRFVARLEQTGHIYVEDGKKWFKSTAFGDDKDRVVMREDGRPTYFAGDIAYHNDKLERGFDHLINVWGADHGGYVARVKAGLAALGYDPGCLEVLLGQMVSLSRGGEAVRMGKRLGTAVWLREVVDEAGRDAFRYFFLMRRLDAQMDFDLELATKRSIENPVYYAQ
ncbi:MAG TPA: arginine--tRNA ligase, partial [Myxococcota bacterium]|nr:arginine--tRNA ligase [Myxococcota bacterium]